MESGTFDLENYILNNSNLNEYNCRFCKRLLKSDKLLYHSELDNTDEIVDFYEQQSITGPNYILIYPNTLLNEILLFYKNFKNYANDKKMNTFILFKSDNNIQLQGKVCCYRRLLASRKIFIK